MSTPLKQHQGVPRNGFVMVCVLWVLAILTLLTIGMGHRAVLDRRAAAYSLDHAEAMMNARAALKRGLVELRNRSFQRMLRGELGVVDHLGQPWARPMNLLQEGQAFSLGKEYEDDVVICRITDEDRRISINASKDSPQDKILKEILKTPVYRRVKARRTEARKEGLRAFQAIEEILSIRGVDEEEWYGEDGEPGLRDLLTVSSVGKVNLNTASKEVLSQIPRIGERIVDGILDYRAGGDGELDTADDMGFQNYDEVAQILEIKDESLQELKKYCKLNSFWFKIRGEATRRAGTVRATCCAVVNVEENGSVTLIGFEEGGFGP